MLGIPVESHWYSHLPQQAPAHVTNCLGRVTDFRDASPVLHRSRTAPRARRWSNPAVRELPKTLHDDLACHGGRSARALSRAQKLPRTRQRPRCCPHYQDGDIRAADWTRAGAHGIVTIETFSLVLECNTARSERCSRNSGREPASLLTVP